MHNSGKLSNTTFRSFQSGLMLNSFNKKFFILALSFFCSAKLVCQQIPQSFAIDIDNASNDSLRIVAMGKLANYYYENFEERKGDSITSKQLQIAESSRNPALVLWVIFNSQGNTFYDLKKNKTYDANRSRLQYALDYSKEHGLNDFIALVYCRMSKQEVEEGNINEGLNKANLAITTSFASANDSVKAICALQLGNAFLAQGNSLMAFRAFNNAYDLSVKKNAAVLAEVYRAIAYMYKSLGQDNTAIEYFLRSLEINQNEGRREEVAKDYIALGKTYSYDIATDYLQKAEKLADSINSNSLKVETQKILFSYTMLEEKPAIAFNFLKQHPQLTKLFEYKGPHYLDWMYGEVFLYAHMPDSARVYFEKAAPYFDSGYSVSQQKLFYAEMADSYYQSDGMDIDKTIFYKEKSLQLSQKISALRDIQTLSKHLSDLYQRKGNFEKALFYSSQYGLYKDSVGLLSREKDLALLEISNEAKRKLEADEIALAKVDRLHNLQYMAITVTVLVAFIILLLLGGFFKVSKLTIKTMGFLSFISFFEFITMLLDKFIHHLAHGEPLKIWLIKITLLSFLLPLHHNLEDKLIHYLLKKQLIEAKNFVGLRKLIARLKRPRQTKKVPAKSIVLTEEDTTIA